MTRADVRGGNVSHEPSALAVIVSGDQADALEGVTFSGYRRVCRARVRASRSSWPPRAWLPRPPFWTATGGTRATRIVKFKSEKPLTGVTLMAAEGSLDPGHRQAYSLRISGQAAIR